MRRLVILIAVTGQVHRQRRRGEELEAALLDAAWEELVEVGFAKMTMESVAARARTGVAVLYRRWTGKDDLAIAAIAHYGRMHPFDAAGYRQPARRHARASSAASTPAISISPSSSPPPSPA